MRNLTRPYRSRRLWAACLGLWALAAACAPSLPRGLNDASQRLYQADYVGAQRTYRQILRRLDDTKRLDVAGHAARRQVLQRLGQINALYLRDYPQAIADFGRLIRLYPQTPAAEAALVEIGNIYQYRQGALAQAIAAYEQVVERFPGSTAAPAAQLEIVHVYFKLKNYPQARAEAAKIIALWPTRPEAVRATFEVADAYYRERHYAQAVQTYDKLLEGQPPSTLATLVRFELGNCYQELGEPQRALDAYYSALPDHPNPTLVQRKIARVRSRIYNLAPSDSILNAQPPSRRLLALQYRRKAQQARHR